MHTLPRLFASRPRDCSSTNVLKFALLLATSLWSATTALAFETVPDGKYLVNGSTVFYVRSSMNNLLVNDGTGNGDVVATSDLFRRTGEVFIAEHVPYVGFTTGSYWSGGSYYVYYQVWNDVHTNQNWGKFTGWRLDDSSSSWQYLWGNGICINLQADNGQYVCANNGGGSTVSADRNSAGAWEEITLWILGGGTLSSGHEIVLGTRDHAKFFSADEAHATPGRLVADRTDDGPWERFTIVKVSGGDQYIRSGDQIALVSSESKYLTADSGGGSTVTANSYSLGAWQTFTITITTAGPR